MCQIFFESRMISRVFHSSRRRDERSAQNEQKPAELCTCTWVLESFVLEYLWNVVVYTTRLVFLSCNSIKQRCSILHVKFKTGRSHHRRVEYFVHLFPNLSSMNIHFFSRYLLPDTYSDSGKNFVNLYQTARDGVVSNEHTKQHWLRLYTVNTHD